MAAERCRSAPPASGAGVGMEMVPYRAPPLTCAGCGRSSSDAPWGQHLVTYSTDRRTVLQKKPVGSGCAACRDTAMVGFAPEVRTWEEVAQLLANDPKKQATFVEWGLRRTGQRLPKHAQAEVRQGVRAGVRWEDVCNVMTMKDFSERYPGIAARQVPGVRVETLADSRGSPQEVVLIRDIASPSRVILYYESEATHHEMLLRPDHHVRQQQGAEWWSQALTRALQTRPSSAAASLDELDELVRRHGPGHHRRSRAAGQQQPFPPAGSGRVEVPQEGALQDPVSEFPREIVDDGQWDGDEMSNASRPQPVAAADAAAPELAMSELEAAAEPELPRGARRLRPQPSDPAAPQPKRKERRQSSSSRRSGATGSGGNDLSVLGLLAGTVEKPKVALYHRRQRLQAIERTADKATVLAEQAEMAALSAADQLQPACLARLTDEELSPLLRVVLQHVSVAELPRAFALGLVRRRTMAAVGGHGLVEADPANLLRVCWPWPLPAKLAATGSAKPRAFDPSAAELCAVTCVDLGEKILWASELLVKDVLVTYMTRKASGLA